MDLNLDRKVAIVTGGASNIGRAISIGLARENASVMIGDIDLAQANKTVEKIKALGHHDVQSTACDVTMEENVEEMFDATVNLFGKVDILVNAVGWDRLQYFTDTDATFWETVININFKGVLNCTAAALKIMNPNGSGVIVSVSSDASKQGEPREAVYGAMKAGVNSFMKTIAKENGRFGVRCNVVCPGVTIPEDASETGENSMWKNIDSMFTDEQLQKVAKALPLKKLGRPDDIANAVLFLASDSAAGHITGQVLSVSGGYSMV